MKVFIAWSGDLSHSVALELRDFLKKAIQSTEPFVSSHDIAKGAAWFLELLKELGETTFGIVVLTPENVNLPWIHFEAGAIVKAFGKSRIAPLLVNLRASDVKSPLSEFQGSEISKSDDIFLLLKSINENLEKPLEQGILKDQFELLIEKFQNKIKDIKTPYAPPVQPRDTKDLLEELLERIKSIQSMSAEQFAQFRKQKELEGVLIALGLKETLPPPPSLQDLASRKPSAADEIAKKIREILAETEKRKKK